MACLRLSALLLLPLVVLACSGEDSQDLAPEPQPGTFGNRLPDSMLEFIAADATDEQRPAFDDGIISFEEYERAVLSTATCLTDAGVQNGPKLEADGFTYNLGITTPDSPEGEAQYEEARRCQRVHMFAIEAAWLTQHQPTEAEIQAAREALAVCLRELGIDVPDNPSSPDFAKLTHEDGFAECARKISTEFDIPNFGG